MSNSNITDWFNYVPAIPVGLRSNYVSLPAFDVAAPDWKGASEEVLQFCYTASKNFYLRNRPTKPDGVNYGLCIRYREGETVYRYKLWEDADFLLGNDAAPLYDGDLIKANFVLEVWSLQDHDTISQDEALAIIASIRTVPDDLRVSTAIAIEALESLEYADLQSGAGELALSPVAGMNIWLDAGDEYTIVKDGGDLVSEWDSAQAGLVNMEQADGAQQPQWIDGTGDGPNLLPYINFNFADVDNNMTSDAQLKQETYFVVIRQNTWTLNRTLWVNGLLPALQSALTPNVRIGGGSLVLSVTDLTLGDWFILRVDQEVGVQGVARVYDFAALLATVTDAGTLSTPAATFRIGSSTVGADISIAEWIGYSDKLSEADGDAVIAYLQQKYGGTAPAFGGLTFNENVAWLDND